MISFRDISCHVITYGIRVILGTPYLLTSFRITQVLHFTYLRHRTISVLKLTTMPPVARRHARLKDDHTVEQQSKRAAAIRVPGEHGTCANDTNRNRDLELIERVLLKPWVEEDDPYAIERMIENPEKAEKATTVWRPTAHVKLAENEMKLLFIPSNKTGMSIPSNTHDVYHTIMLEADNLMNDAHFENSLWECYSMYNYLCNVYLDLIWEAHIEGLRSSRVEQEWEIRDEMRKSITSTLRKGNNHLEARNEAYSESIMRLERENRLLKEALEASLAKNTHSCCPR